MKNTSLNTEQFWMTVHQKRYQKFAISVAIEMNKASKKRKAKKKIHQKDNKSWAWGGLKQLFPPICKFCKFGERKGSYEEIKLSA